MTDCTEIKIKIEMAHGLFIKKNEKGVDETLLQSLNDLKRRFEKAPWLKVLDLPKTENQERLIEFAESRRCLLVSIEKCTSLDSVNSENDIYISLSHTTTHSVAFAVLDNQQMVKGIGVDLELKSREIKPEVYDKFTFRSEEGLGLNPLERWTIKEASFKAGSNETKSEKNTLFQYEIKEFDTNRREGKTARMQSGIQTPTHFTSFQLHSLGNLLVTIAIDQR